MAKKKKQQNIPGIVITAVAALLAVASVIFLIITISRSNEEDPPVSGTTTADPGFVPDDDFIHDVEQAAYDLLQENYTIHQYLLKGMEVEEEPYGNLPEDGFYTCITDDFADYDEFCDYVHSVFVDKVAEKLLTDPFGNGPVYGYDQDGLGITMDFEPSDAEELSWADVYFTCEPVSETECFLVVTLKDAEGKDAIRELRLLIEDGSWKLSELVA